MPHIVHDDKKGPLKKFLVFSVPHYEAAGGMFDLDDSFDTFEEAKKYALNIYTSNRSVNLFDCETRLTYFIID